MSGEFDAAIVGALKVDVTLTALLSTYEGSPAVFTDRPVPPDAQAPYVFVSESVVDRSFDTLKELGRDFAKDLWVVFPQFRAKDLKTAAEQVRTIFHKQALSVTGFQTVQVFASGPTAGFPEDTSGAGQDNIPEIARIVTVRAILRNL